MENPYLTIAHLSEFFLQSKFTSEDKFTNKTGCTGLLLPLQCISASRFENIQQFQRLASLVVLPLVLGCRSITNNF